MPIKLSELDELLGFNNSGLYVHVLDSNDTSLAATGTNKKAEISNIVANASLATQGYYAVLTDFYFTSGEPTVTEITVAEANTWVDVDFNVATGGTFDRRPITMKMSDPTGWDETTGFFNLEGLTTTAFCSFRASMSFEPDEDEGQLEARLFFERHTGTVPNDPFPIEDVILTMNQGADIEYPAEPLLSFFVGDTIDTNSEGDAGRCKFQIKSSVAGTVRMRALTWYINK